MDEHAAATARPETILGHAYGIYPSLAMLAGLELDLFTPLGDGPLAADSLAHALGVKPDKLGPLLYALVAAGLLTVAAGRFANTAESDAFLVRGRPRFMGGQAGFYRKLWQAALHTAASIRAGEPELKIDWEGLPEAELEQFFAIQCKSSLRAGEELAGKLDLSGAGHLLDAGGGSGGVAMALCRHDPKLQATVADLPKVAALARRFVAAAGLADRVAVAASDLCAAPVPGRFDAAIARALLQTLSLDQAGRCLKHIGRSLVPGGTLYVIGSFLDDSRLAPRSVVGANLVFLNFYDEGRAYTEAEHEAMLDRAGFAMETVEHEALDDGMGIITARKC